MEPMDILDRILNDFQNRKGTDFDYYAIVTGANSGIGFETTRVLAANGYNVIMACRSLEKANEAKRQIEEMIEKDVKKTSSSSNVVCGKLIVMHCDLNDLDSVKSFAEQVIQDEYKVNRLINNAGIMIPPFTLTKQGYECQFGANYLAHFLLSHLLLKTLHKYGPSRIINVSSSAHWTGYIDWNNISPKTLSEYNACTGYTQSKVCQIMSTYKMQRYLDEIGLGSKITVNVLHPGVVKTNIMSNLWAWATFLYNLFVASLTLTPIEGAVNTLYLTLSSEVENISGKYFVHCSPQKSNNATFKVNDQERLWKLSLEMIEKYLKE
jgi:NAD(P)-dependent dehydrogenase (short-subunit alcohol dehydrogenase family)